MTDYRLKMGVRFGIPEFTTEGQFYSSVVLSAKSGRYVVYDKSYDAWIPCGDNEIGVGGYVEHSLICNATDKTTVLPIATNIDDFVTEMPYGSGNSAGTLTKALLLDTIGGIDAGLIDFYVDGSNIQYADASSNQDMLIPVGGSVKNNTLYVTVSSVKILRVT